MFGLLRRIPGYRLLVVVLVPVAIGVTAMLHVGRGAETRRADRHALDGAAEAAARLIVAARPPTGVVLVLPFAGDGDGSVTDAVAEHLAQHSPKAVREHDAVDASVRGLVAALNAVLMGGSEIPNDGELAPAVEAGRKAGASAVVFGKVIDRSASEGEAHLTLAVGAARVADGRSFMAERVEHHWRPSALERWMSAQPWWGRMCVWMAVTALLPLATGPLARRVLARENNWLNAALLASYTAVSAVLTWFLLGFAGGGAVFILVLLAAVAAGVYHCVICDRLSEAAA